MWKLEILSHKHILKGHFPLPLPLPLQRVPAHHWPRTYIKNIHVIINVEIEVGLLQQELWSLNNLISMKKEEEEYE
jgi:hypothetical protein